MNGKEAVSVWRTGGFHLVLMDIQLPVMNGLDATKEIRRLEALNRIGVLSGSPLGGFRRLDLNGSGVDGDIVDEELKSEDRLEDVEAMFKSPVIIVALTASSLQSDRHQALAAGCNDFLTKVCVPCSFDLSHSFYFCLVTHQYVARQLCLDGTQSHRMGLHASAYRLQRLAQMEKPGCSRRGE